MSVALMLPLSMKTKWYFEWDALLEEAVGISEIEVPWAKLRLLKTGALKLAYAGVAGVLCPPLIQAKKVNASRHGPALRQPLFQYRCEAQRWVEDGQDQWICCAGDMACERMLGINGTTVETDWTSLAEVAMMTITVSAVSTLVSMAVVVMVMIRMRGVYILGTLAEQDTNTGGRRAECGGVEAGCMEGTWGLSEVQLQLAIVPNELATAAASQAAEMLWSSEMAWTALAQIPSPVEAPYGSGDLPMYQYKKGPTGSASSFDDSSSRGPDRVRDDSEASVESVWDLLSFVARGPAEERCPRKQHQSSELRQEDDTDNQTTVVEEEEGIDARGSAKETAQEQLLLFLLVVPIACIGGFFVSLVYLKPCGLEADVDAGDVKGEGSSNQKAPKYQTEPWKVDFQFIVKEERLSDDHAADVTVSKALFLRLVELSAALILPQVKAYERAQTILAHKDTERVYDLRDLGASKQLPNVGDQEDPSESPMLAKYTLQSLQQQSTTDMKLRSQVALTPRTSDLGEEEEEKGIWKKSQALMIFGTRDSFFEQFRKDGGEDVVQGADRAGEEVLHISVNRSGRREFDWAYWRFASFHTRTPEIPVTRGRRGSVGRVSLSSCTAAEAMADGLERGLDPEQATGQIEGFCGNIVTEKVMQARTYNEEEDAAERHTLKFHPPTRKRIKEMESAEEENLDEDASEEADDVIAADEDDKPADSGRDASDPESDEGMSALASALDTDSKINPLMQEIEQIRELLGPSDDRRSFILRCERTARVPSGIGLSVHNRRTEEEGPDEGPKAQAKLAEPLPKQLDARGLHDSALELTTTCQPDICFKPESTEDVVAHEAA
ncbi:hypothetical protein AK812_SmicGene8512 [Symbiodinium microadriaticum]|uniref:Uncharacterized protein n=1 Tax=Symbiodinium microadriaticum TaxID=2951 RepID=A0A1Q9EKR8_SYMMI|nr:hypothetical protein AK812_SmicGene8512 [Symbiodinium microadriaticum]